MKWKCGLLLFLVSCCTMIVSAQERDFWDKLRDKAIDKAIDIGLDYAAQSIEDAIRSSKYNPQPGEVPSRATFRKNYRGAVNGKYNFHVTLLRNGENLSGVLYYDKYKTNMSVSGVIDRNDNFIFYEYFEHKLTGIYTGYIKGREIHGVFTSGDGKRVYTYYLDEE